MFLTRLQLFFTTILLHIVLPIMLLAAFWVLGKENLVSTIVLTSLIGISVLTPSPHLHMHVSKCEDGLYWSGEGIPIFFKALGYPIKNRFMKI